MLCSRCKKREAMVFITSMQGNEKRNEGLCLVCARELNVPQIKEYMDQMGVTDDDIEEFADAMSGTGDNFDMEMFNQGGTNSLPSFFNALFGGGTPPNQNNSKPFAEKNDDEDIPSEAFERRERIKTGKDAKSSKNKKRKYLSSFCTDLTSRAKEGKLDTIIGRDKEITRTIQILCRSLL
jgi:ATP-dependent Clp protease ATP-binding subunit ClpA